MKASSFSSRKKHSELPPAFPPGIFPSVFELFPDPLIISDWKSGRLLWSNRAAEKSLGYSQSDLREMDISTLLPESMMDRLPSILRDEQKKNGLSVRTTLCRKAGEPLPVEMRTRLFREGEDTLRCMIARDLSGDDLPDAEDRPRDAASLFPRLFGEQEMVFEISPEGYLVSGNAICLQKTGYTRNDLREGVPFDRIIPPEERERVRRDFERLRRGERLEALEYTIVHKDGSALPFILSFSPAPSHRVRGVALDITEHRRVEHELVIREKLNMLGELAGGVVHNFNNILTVILGYLELLSTENMDESGQRVIQNIRRAALDGSDIVHRIQNFSNSSETAEIEPADLNEVVREVLEFMKPHPAPTAP
ncbi:MAG TPA: PAS domain S-box protein [Armatimonadota bacterium]|nr:PAS domain S-box protein [Armatimonadota bacterium]